MINWTPGWEWGNPHVCHALAHGCARGSRLEFPLSRLRYQEVAENLHLLRGFELFGVDEIDGHRGQLRLLQHGYDVGFIAGQIIGNEPDADAGTDRIFHSDHAVGGKCRPARCLAVEPCRFEPADRGEMRGRRAAVGNDRMFIECVDRFGRTEAADILGGSVGVQLHVEEGATNEVALLRLAGPDGDVGGPHGDGDLLVAEDQLDADLRIELEELAQPLRDPNGAEADRRRDPEVARWLGGGVGEERLGGRELVHDLARRTEQHLPLFGEHQPARMTVEERDLQLLLQRRYLPADRGLAHAQRLTGVGEAAGLGGGMKDAELVPVHGGVLRMCERATDRLLTYSAASAVVSTLAK